MSTRRFHPRALEPGTTDYLLRTSGGKTAWTKEVELITGDHASRPAANAVRKNSLYSCTTHSIIYQSDGSSWSNWLALTFPTLTVQDENSNISTAVTQIDFQGSGVSVTSGTGEVIVTISGGGGGSGSTLPLDTVPASPNAKDDEFDGTTLATWTNTPTAANTWNVNGSYPGDLYWKASGSGSNYVGKTQAVPASYPYTIMAKQLATTARANFHRGGGIVLGPASPTGSSSLVYLGPVYNSNLQIQRVSGTFGGGFSSSSGGPQLLGATLWIRMVVSSATAVLLQYSQNGYFWSTIDAALNPGFTPGVFGIAGNEESSGGGVEALFDWIRVS